MSANDLSTLLWRERELLELLVFKLEEEQLLLTAGRSKWLHHATREVEAVLARIRTAGIERTVEASSVAVEWGLGEDATLRQLVERRTERGLAGHPAPHLTALTALTAQIADVRDTNLTYLRAATRATQETLATVGAGRAGPRLRRPGRARDRRRRRVRPPLRSAGLSRVASTFGILNSAFSGLTAAKAALDVTGQNIANVDTEGYTRQRVQQAAVPGTQTPALFSKGAAVGAGVTVLGVARLNDSLIDTRVARHGVDERLLEHRRRLVVRRRELAERAGRERAVGVAERSGPAGRTWPTAPVRAPRRARRTCSSGRGSSSPRS